jgi:hypothetical protein
MNTHGFFDPTDALYPCAGLGTASALLIPATDASSRQWWIPVANVHTLTSSMQSIYKQIIEQARRERSLIPG